VTNAFYIFLGFVGLFVATLFYFFHEVLRTLPALLAEHARVYARSYVKGTCLVLITAGAAFKDTFSGLTAQDAMALTWWGWAIMFWAPITAALGVIIAFLDTSVATSKDKETADLAGGTKPPFAQPPSKPNP
jgi:hypothetical protein